MCESEASALDSQQREAAGSRHLAPKRPNRCVFLFFYFIPSVSLSSPSAAMLQADDEDDMMEMQIKSPFGSSFRTFNATDYKPIGETVK